MMSTAGISKTDFDFLRLMIRQRSAIVIEDGKEYLAETRLDSVMRSRGFGTLADLVNALRLQKDESLTRAVIEAMAIGETYFFRDMEAFRFLREVVVPAALEHAKTTRRLRVWCGASSTGQEPYSVAMLLDEILSSRADKGSWDVRIFASDISSEAIARCRSGRYSQQEVNRGLPARMLVKYFRRAGLDWEINEELRQYVEFQTLNLLDPWPKIGPFDVVLLRNVLIYFDLDAKREVLRRLRQTVGRHGFALFGAAETMNLLDPKYELQANAKSMWFRIRA